MFTIIGFTISRIEQIFAKGRRKPYFPYVISFHLILFLKITEKGLCRGNMTVQTPKVICSYGSNNGCKKFVRCRIAYFKNFNCVLR